MLWQSLTNYLLRIQCRSVYHFSAKQKKDLAKKIWSIFGKYMMDAQNYSCQNFGKLQFIPHQDAENLSHVFKSYSTRKKKLSRCTSPFWLKTWLILVSNFKLTEKKVLWAEYKFLKKVKWTCQQEMIWLKLHSMCIVIIRQLSHLRNILLSL